MVELQIRWMSTYEWVNQGLCNVFNALRKIWWSALGHEYLRALLKEDSKSFLTRSTASGFPGMIGSIDCSKWM